MGPGGTNTIPLPVQTGGSMGTDVWGASCSGKYTNETGINTIPLPVQTGGSMGTDVWGASCSGKYTNETGTNTIPLPVQTGGSMGTDVWGPAVLVSIPMRLVPIQYHYLCRL